MLGGETGIVKRPRQARQWAETKGEAGVVEMWAECLSVRLVGREDLRPELRGSYGKDLNPGRMWLDFLPTRFKLAPFLWLCCLMNSHSHTCLVFTVHHLRSA